MPGAGNQQERLSSLEQRRWFLAGVVEGEGSVCLAVKANPALRFGFFVQPEFYVYQHRLRRGLLEMAQDVLRCGTIFPKPGNRDVLVYAVKSRSAIDAHVAPFVRRYMEYSHRQADLALFLDARALFREGHHHHPAGLATIVEIAYAMNGAGKLRKRPIEDVLDRILRGHTPDTPGQG